MDIKERKKLYKELCAEYDISSKILNVEFLDDIGFLTAPASTKYHGAYEGGLFDHSYAVTKELLKFTEKLGLTWQAKRSPIVVGMFHDFCKIESYNCKEQINKDTGEAEVIYEYNQDMIIPGHGDKSIILLTQYMPLTPEEIACIRWHMGAYETDTNMWNYYGRAIKQYPNVLYTHTADMVASKILGV